MSQSERYDALSGTENLIILNFPHLKKTYDSVEHKLVSFLFLPAFFYLKHQVVLECLLKCNLQRFRIIPSQTLNNLIM